MLLSLVSLLLLLASEKKLRASKHDRSGKAVIFNNSFFCCLLPLQYITFFVIAIAVIAVAVMVVAIKMETNHYLLLIAVVNGHLFNSDFPVSLEP